MTSVGTKVTTDPASKQPIPEAVGVVTSDSLAAESLNQNGSFGEGNVHAAASKQPSKSTTTNNTDTSSATKLAPAVDAEAREAQEGWSENQQLNAGKGLAKDAGVGPTYNTSSGAGAGSTGDQTGSIGGYAGAADQARDPGEFRPKGTDLKEGDLQGESKSAEIGSENDPARVAEQKIQKRTALSGADAGTAKDTSIQEGQHTYSALSSDQAVPNRNA